MRDVADVLSDFIELAEERAWDFSDAEVVSCVHCGATNGDNSIPEHKEDCGLLKLIKEAENYKFWNKTSEVLPEKYRTVLVSWPSETRLAYYLGVVHAHCTGWRDYPGGLSVAAPNYWAYIPLGPKDER
jgi:hypothetical protein